MNNENQNQDTLEQDQNALPAVSPEPAAVPASTVKPETWDLELHAAPIRIQTRGRVSKVSLLPSEIREFINAELLYGTPCFIILKALEDPGFKPEYFFKAQHGPIKVDQGLSNLIKA